MYWRLHIRTRIISIAIQLPVRARADSDVVRAVLLQNFERATRGLDSLLAGPAQDGLLNLIRGGVTQYILWRIRDTAVHVPVHGRGVRLTGGVRDPVRGDGRSL